MKRRVNKAVRSLLGSQLREQRASRGLSQEILGEKASLSGKFIGWKYPNMLFSCGIYFYEYFQALDARVRFAIN